MVSLNIREKKCLHVFERKHSVPKAALRNLAFALLRYTPALAQWFLFLHKLQVIVDEYPLWLLNSKDSNCSFQIQRGERKLSVLQNRLIA